MKKMVLPLLCLLLASSNTLAGGAGVSYTLSEAVRYALKNNPGLAASGKDIMIEAYGIDRAKAEKMPRVDIIGGVTRYRYPTPITPISGSPLAGVRFPEFDNTISEGGVTLLLPIYRGGRLEREVRIAEMRKLIAEDIFRWGRQDLVYNITSVFYKIGQLEKLLVAKEAAVRQLEVHRRNVEHFLQAGTAPAVELLKTDAELAHAMHEALLTRNGLESTQGLLMSLMGIEDQATQISVVMEDLPVFRYSQEEDAERALSQRPDYLAVLKKEKLAEDRIKLAEGRRFPSVFFSGEYGERTGTDVSFKENWNLAMRLSLPVFDGGAITAEVNRARQERERAGDEVRNLRLEILREIRDAHLNVESAAKRMEVAERALETARENLRIEMLKYETGAGTTADVIDAQTMLLRAEADVHQARFDNNIAMAALRRAVGEDMYKEEVYR